MSFALLAALLLPPLAFAEPGFTFKKQGKLIKAFPFEEMKQRVAPTKITVHEPHEDKPVTYSGIKMSSLLDAAYGPTWRDAEELLFTCTDGYQPSIPGERFKKQESFVAFSREGSPTFSLNNRFHNGEVVELGPFYLVWDNLKNTELKQAGGEGWPYQVVGVDLIKFSERFPNLAPPPGASASANTGFLLFRKHCLSCHTLNGEGGSKGVELNYPVSVVEYFDRKMLKRWITDPSTIRFSSAMPAFNHPGPEGDSQIEAILSYFDAMSKNKKKPVGK